MRMLPVDVHQMLSCLAQLHQRRCMAIDESTRPAAAIHHPPQQYAAGVAVQGLLRQPQVQRAFRRQGKFRADVRTLRAATNLFGA